MTHDTLIRIQVNGRPREVGTDNLLAALRELGLDVERRTGLAVALNGSVVPRGSWAGATLSANDELEVIGAVQGG